jgi:hypothetical protein
MAHGTDDTHDRDSAPATRGGDGALRSIQAMCMALIQSNATTYR